MIIYRSVQSGDTQVPALVIRFFLIVVELFGMLKTNMPFVKLFPFPMATIRP